MHTLPSKKLMTVKDAAIYLNLSTSTLNKWRVSGNGPAFLKLGRVIRYREEDLRSYIEQNTQRSTSAY